MLQQFRFPLGLRPLWSWRHLRAMAFSMRCRTPAACSHLERSRCLLLQFPLLFWIHLHRRCRMEACSTLIEWVLLSGRLWLPRGCVLPIPILRVSSRIEIGKVICAYIVLRAGQCALIIRSFRILDRMLTTDSGSWPTAVARWPRPDEWLA